MPKHNQRKNPLSNARKQNGSASNLWYRKAGFGYKAFIAYYSTVLKGPQSQSSDMIQEKPSSKHTNSSTIGMSRAAKRRRKKKQGNSHNEEDSSPTELPASPQTTSCADPPPAPTDAPTRHPLHRAWIEADRPPQLKSFVATLCRPLPVTVRIRQTSLQKETIATELTNLGFQTIQSGSIFQTSTSKGELSDELRQTLMEYSQSGDIARQELGSMLPVHLLAAVVPFRKTCRVLDVCASPGSKTLQALEAFQGSIVANDVNSDRLDILRQAVARSGMNDTERIQYTCQDASTLKLHSKEGDIAKFRVILCDVPCSGDGTCRKDPSILPQWKPSIGNNLHSVQLSILRRGLVLLKPGGYLCYSTCSMYPVENEAVVAAALEQHGADVELVECPPKAISGIQLKPGFKQWTVAGQVDRGDDDNGVVVYESYESAKKQDSDSSWLPSMWPSTDSSVTTQVPRCCRLWPTSQDSGGFFVALFHKKA